MGHRIAFQHPHDAGTVPAASQLVDPLLLAFLNNKANLADLVPPGYCPPRRVADRQQISALVPTTADPVVLKLATDLSTGAAGAVVIARSATDIAGALRRFPEGNALIVEDFIPHARSLCLNFAATGDEVVFLGGADQLVDLEGVHRGSLLGEPAPDRLEEAIEVGFEITRRAVRRGYRGVAGFDVAFGEDLTRPMVFDLNFRFCASTLPLIWFASISEQQNGCHAGRMSVVSGPADFAPLATRLRDGVASGAVFPYAAFDPAATEHRTAAPVARVLIVGENRRQVEDRLASLRGAGLTCS